MFRVDSRARDTRDYANISLSTQKNNLTAGKSTQKNIGSRKYLGGVRSISLASWRSYTCVAIIHACVIESD